MIFELNPDDAQGLGAKKFRELAGLYGLPSERIQVVFTTAAYQQNYSVAGGGAQGGYATLEEVAIATTMPNNARPTPNFFYWGCLDIGWNVVTAGASSFYLNQTSVIRGVTIDRALIGKQNVVLNDTLVYSSGGMTSFQYFTFTANNGGAGTVWTLGIQFQGFKVYCA